MAVRSTPQAGGRRGKERAASLLAEQRLAAGGPQGSPDPELTRDTTFRLPAGLPRPGTRDEPDPEAHAAEDFLIGPGIKCLHAPR